MAKPLIFNMQSAKKVKFKNVLIGESVIAYIAGAEPIFRELGHGRWTGQARAHLWAMAQAVATSNLTSAKSKIAANKWMTVLNLPSKYSSKNKNPITGLSKSEATFIEGWLSTEFKFKTTIPYFDINETTHTEHHPSTPWNSVEEGLKSVRAYLQSDEPKKSILDRLKNLFGFGKHKI